MIYGGRMMKRQNERKLILIISLLLFPVTMWYMSPYLIIQGAMEGIVTGSFIVFIGTLFGAIFLGRSKVRSSGWTEGVSGRGTRC